MPRLLEVGAEWMKYGNLIFSDQYPFQVFEQKVEEWVLIGFFRFRLRNDI